MINYIIQVFLFQLLFLILYDVLLSKETIFYLYRVYLIFSALIAFIIPLIKFDRLSNYGSTVMLEQLPSIILNPQQKIANTISLPLVSQFKILLLIVMVVMFTLFMYKIISILLLILNNKKEIFKSFTIVHIHKTGEVFSFFRYIFIDKSFSTRDCKPILKHELVHVKSFHSLDLLLFEILKIVNWFNPIIYIYQHRITELHEFIADSKTVKPGNKKAFFNSLIGINFKTTKIDFVNQFYKHSLIKKRIIMTNKEKSKKVFTLKYLLMLPLLASMIIFTSCQQKKQTISQQIATLKASLKQKDSFNKKEKREMMSLISAMMNKNKRVQANHISFSKVEQVPIYPGCESAKDKKTCFTDKITELISKNFSYKLANNLHLKPGLKRVFVLFNIDKNGHVANVRARAPHVKLEEEAKRVINLIPPLTPAMQNGKNVAIRYSLPIAINVQ